jgi:hypothetical protein
MSLMIQNDLTVCSPARSGRIDPSVMGVASAMSGLIACWPVQSRGPLANSTVNSRGVPSSTTYLIATNLATKSSRGVDPAGTYPSGICSHVLAAV